MLSSTCHHPSNIKLKIQKQMGVWALNFESKHKYTAAWSLLNILFRITLSEQVSEQHIFKLEMKLKLIVLQLPEQMWKLHKAVLKTERNDKTGSNSTGLSIFSGKDRPRARLLYRHTRHCYTISGLLEQTSLTPEGQSSTQHSKRREVNIEG